MEAEFYTVEDVAGLMQVSRSLVYRWASEGSIPVVKVKNAIRIPKTAFNEWVAKQTTTAS